MNGFFLYKQREVRERLLAGEDLHTHIGFDGLVVTDSGAFQGFGRPLYLDNRTIIGFQQAIGSDVASPLDLVTPPGDKRAVAEKKMRATIKRVAQGLALCDRCLLAAVQQGGRYMALRRESLEALLALEPGYLALGSLVPFFNQRHDLSLIGPVIAQARALAGPDLPMHVYGAGDPLELPFFVALGANVFDSSSYIHFAREGWFMTPYGAVRRADDPDESLWRCPCPACVEGRPAVFDDLSRLARHNLHVILAVVREVRACLDEGRLGAYLAEVVARHEERFPASRLPDSWRALREAGIAP